MRIEFVRQEGPLERFVKGAETPTHYRVSFPEYTPGWAAGNRVIRVGEQSPLEFDHADYDIWEDLTMMAAQYANAAMNGAPGAGMAGSIFQEADKSKLRRMLMHFKMRSVGDNHNPKVLTIPTLVQSLSIPVALLRDRAQRGMVRVIVKESVWLTAEVPFLYLSKESFKHLNNILQQHLPLKELT